MLRGRFGFYFTQYKRLRVDLEGYGGVTASHGELQQGFMRLTPLEAMLGVKDMGESNVIVTIKLDELFRDKLVLSKDRNELRYYHPFIPVGAIPFYTVTQDGMKPGGNCIVIYPMDHSSSN